MIKGLLILILACGVSKGASFATNTLLVKFNSADTNESDTVITGLGLTNHAFIAGANVHVVKGPQGQLNALSNHVGVLWAERDQLVHYHFIPNDPLYSQEWYLPKIQAPSAWDTTTGSNNIVIAILDSGMESTHADLAANAVAGYNFYDNNSDTSPIDTHGTSVAGIAAAVGNNSIGVSGVTMNCKLMPLRITDTNGFALFSTMATAVTYAANNGARVANLSFGAKDSLSVSNAAKYLSSLGGVLVISSGNETTFDATPENPYELVVGATDQNDVLATWSNTGNNQDLVAPGVTIKTTTLGSSYGSGTGTSFSSPVVAGVAALVMACNPVLTGPQVQAILKSTADDLGPPGWDSSYGWGRVNAFRAVSAAFGNTLICTPIPGL
jgi:subtilisin family serine protease